MVLVAGVLAWSATGGAQPSSPAAQSPIEQGRLHFARGEELYAGGQYALSLSEFRRVYELLSGAGHRNAPIVLYNVARCYVELGRNREAVETFEQFLRDAPEDAQMINEARIELRELRARVSLGTASGAGGISPVGPVVLAVGGAALLAGATTGIVALLQHGDATAQCVGTACPAGVADALDAAHGLAIASDALLFGGLGIAALGAVLLAVVRDGSGEPAPATATCSGEGCFVGVRGSF